MRRELSNDEKICRRAKRLKQEKERLRQWKEARAERDRIDGEIGRLRARAKLARLGGKSAQGIPPLCAQHLCTRIAAMRSAFSINQSGPDRTRVESRTPIQLRVVPGIAVLRCLGGEQTKLALAMTLAMIRNSAACASRF